MTKRECYSMADVLYRTMQEFEGSAAAPAIELIAQRMADVFERDVEEFHREQFLTAAGVKS